MRYQNGKSSLMDLKLYGSEFMKINEDNYPFLSTAPSLSPQKSKHQSLPQITKSLDISFNSLQYGLPHEQIKKLQQQMTKKHEESGKPNKSLTKVEKLRSKISVIKKLNQQKHRDILDMYNKNSSDLVADFHVNKKSIQNIRLFDPQKQQKKIKAKQKREQNEQFLNRFYDSLQKEDEISRLDYSKRLSEIQNTLKNSQIPRKVQQFLVSRNMRIPKFLKQLKY